MSRVDACRALLLSPHSDDIAFSLGGTLEEGSTFGRWRLHQLTLFVRSCHAPYAPELGDVEAVTAVRCREDDAFCRHHGIGLERSDMAETLLRGYPSIESIYTVARPEDDPLFERTCQVVARAADDFDLLIAPVGIGGHIEHVMVREASRRTFREGLLYYEDLPYAGDFGNDNLDDMVGRALPGAHCLVVDITEGETGKEERLLGYRSQVAPRDLGKLGRYSRERRPAPGLRWPRAPGGGERVVEVLWGSCEALQLLQDR